MKKLATALLAFALLAPPASADTAFERAGVAYDRRSGWCKISYTTLGGPRSPAALDIDCRGASRR